MPAEKTQKAKFIETAREISADEDEAAFEAKLKKLGGHKPEKGGKNAK